MGAMVFSAQCRLLGAGPALPATAPRFSSPSLAPPSSLSTVCAKTRPRFLRIRATSSSPPVEAPPVGDAPAAASAVSTSSTAVDDSPPPEPESASMETLEMPAPAAATSTSLVSRTPQIVTPEGAAGLAQVNHYRILQIPYGSTSDQIFQAYKDRVEEVKIQEKELGEEVASEQLRGLKVSFDILNSEEERRVYDWVLQRYENRSMDTYIWPYETDITQRYTNKEPVPVMRSFDQEGNNRVGLFLLGWVLLSFVLSLSMKTWIPYPHFRDP